MKSVDGKKIIEKFLPEDMWLGAEKIYQQIDNIESLSTILYALSFLGAMFLGIFATGALDMSFPKWTWLFVSPEHPHSQILTRVFLPIIPFLFTIAAVFFPLALIMIPRQVERRKTRLGRSLRNDRILNQV
ncbi:MAG: hypothetical protein FJZ04_04480, partial [Candidatus Moranbacteria bacterium]|nr:hypothetical protein [Candidatus Moranbacteria bacterium]